MRSLNDRFVRVWILFVAVFVAAEAPAQSSSPITLVAGDTRNDGGRSIDVTWTSKVTLPADTDVVIERVLSGGEAIEVGSAKLGDGKFVDAGSGEGTPDEIEPPQNGVSYTYRLRVVDGLGTVMVPAVSNAASSSGQWFHTERWNVLSLLLILFAFVLINIYRSSRGTTFFVRRLTPVDAIDEAIGRATEMGRPVLYVPGIEEVEDIQTIASMLILERVAQKTATYDVDLHVPVRTPFVLAVADEVVKTGCSSAGRPDAYQPDHIRFISTEQFAYCAGVNGTILREKPAANLYLGRFFAESLIFAETGFAAGAIQIAGTAEVTQLPFFIAACDYTLIGEEFFAAGAYLSQDPALLSTLKAADWAKVFLVSVLIVGAVLESAGVSAFREWFLVR